MLLKSFGIIILLVNIMTIKCQDNDTSITTLGNNNATSITTLGINFETLMTTLEIDNATSITTLGNNYIGKQ